MQHLKNEQVNKSPIEQQSKVSFIALVGLHSWELQRHCSDCSAGQKRAFIVKLSESPVLDPLFPGNQYLGIRHTTRSLTGYLWHLAIFSSYWSLAFTNSRFPWVFVCTNHFVFVFFFKFCSQWELLTDYLGCFLTGLVKEQKVAYLHIGTVTSISKCFQICMLCFLYFFNYSSCSF